MTSEQVLRALSHNQGYFPQRAVEHAQQMQAELAPVLLQALADAAADPAAIASRDDYLLPIYAMFLLARWRESAAFPLLIELFSRDDEVIEEIAGDVLTEDLQSLLASVFPGDLAELDRVVCNLEYSQYLRGAVVQCLTVLYLERGVEREQTLDRFAKWLEFYLRAGLADDFALSCLVTGVSELQLRELLPQLERAYENQLVDGLLMPLSEVREELESGSAGGRPQKKQHRYVYDVVEAVGWWSCFEGFDTDDVWTDAFEPRSVGDGGC